MDESSFLKREIDERDSFADVERDFQTVIQEIVQDKTLEKFRISYEELHEALIQSQKHNQALVDKCKTLNRDILQNAGKITQVLLLSQQDQQTIGNLRNEFEKVWKIISQCEEKEKKTLIITESLKAELQRLTSLVEDTANLTPTFQVSQQEAQREVDFLNKEIQDNEKEMEEMRKKIEELTQETHKLQENNQEKKSEIQGQEDELNQCLDIIKDNCKILQQNICDIDNCKADIDNMSNDIQSKNNDIENMNNTLKRKNNELAILKKQEMQENLDKVRLIRNHKKLQNTLMKTKMSGKKIMAKIDDQKQYQKMQQMKFNGFPEDLKKLQEEENELLQLQKETVKYKHELTSLRDEARKEKQIMIGIIDDMKTDNAQVLNQKKTAQIDFNAQSQQVTNMELQILEEKAMKKAESDRIKKSEHEKLDYKKQHQKDLEIKETYDEQTKNFQDKTKETLRMYNQILEDNAEYEKKINEGYKKAKQMSEEIDSQTKKYDKEKKLYDKEVKLMIELQREQKDLENEINIMDNEMLRIKYEIASMDKSTAETHLELLSKLEDVKMLEHEIQQIKNDINDTLNKDKEIQEQLSLSSMILQMGYSTIDMVNRDNEAFRNEIRSLHRQNYTIGKERDKARLRLDRAELQIKEGSKAYEKRLNEVENLKQEFDKHLSRCFKLENKLRQSVNLKKEYLRMQTALETERQYAKACENEIQTPRMIHRWTFLESTDPEKMALINMKQGIINITMEKSYQQRRLKEKLDKTKQELEEINKHVEKAEPIDFNSQMTFWTQQLKSKTTLLSKLEQQVLSDKGKIQEQTDDITITKDLLQTEKSSLRETQKINYDLRAETAATPRLPKLKVRRQDTFFIGGGFALGTPRMPTPGKTPQSARVPRNPRLDLFTSNSPRAHFQTPREPKTPRYSVSRRKLSLPPLNL